MADNEAGYFVLGIIVGAVAFYLYTRGTFGAPSMGTTYAAPVIVQRPGWVNPFFPGQPIPPGHIIPL